MKTVDQLCERIMRLATVVPDSDYEFGSIAGEVREAVETRDAFIVELQRSLAARGETCQSLREAVAMVTRERDEATGLMAVADATMQAWRDTMPLCQHIDPDANGRSCQRIATMGPQDEPDDGVLFWCDDHAPKDRDTMDMGYPEDLKWADLVRAGEKR